MTPTAPALVPPAAVRIIDVEAQLGDLRLPSGRGGDSYRSLLAVARLGGDPLGTAVVSVDSPGVVPGDRLAHELRRQLDRELQEAPPERGAHGRPPRSGPAVTVVVTTCRRPEALARCLRSILDCEYEEFEVIVVENRPGSSATSWMLAEEFPDHPRVRYVDEPGPGVSRARNAGLALADGELVAFTDDDVLVEPGWLGRSVAGFERSDDIACVTGLILPPGLESDDELFLEQFIGAGKGLQRRIYRLGQARNGYLSLLLAPGVVGSGANTVLRADVARELGGFDVTLGAGTRAGGGEVLDLYVRLLRDARAVAYEPSAIVWHTDPDGASPLRRQVRRHGVGLGALLTKRLITGRERRDVLRAVPARVRFAGQTLLRAPVADPVRRRGRGPKLVRRAPRAAGRRNARPGPAAPGGGPASRKRPVDQPGAPRHGRDRCSRVRASTAARRRRGAIGGRPPRPHRPHLPGARHRPPHPRPREAGEGTDAGDRAGRGSRRHPVNAGARRMVAEGAALRARGSLPAAAAGPPHCHRPPAAAHSRMCSTEQNPSAIRWSPRWRTRSTWTSPSSASHSEQRRAPAATPGGSAMAPASQCGPRIAHGTTCSSRQKVAARSPAGS